MDQIIIRGGIPLSGKVEISGAKNAALPLMAAALLTDGEVTLMNLPYLADITSMANLLAQHGVGLSVRAGAAKKFASHQAISLSAGSIANFTAPYELVRKMRASILVLGPLLARFGQAKISLPGGCAIGTRPVDMHLAALKKMGAKIELKDGYIIAKAKRLKGAVIDFDKVSVGATENLLMAATLAEGKTVLNNAALEPEIGDLANCLIGMGARITGVGTSRLEITGVTSLKGTRYSVIADRIETGSFIVAAAMTGGEIELLGTDMALLGESKDRLKEAGVSLRATKNGIKVKASGGLRAVDIETAPFPAFATDMQAQFMTMMCIAEGSSRITETIFENRFMHVPELMRMGADISVSGHTAVVKGVKALKAAPVMATDLRASVSLVLAGLAAAGETVVSRVYHLDRGYERIEEKLAELGADIRRVRQL